MIPCTPDYATVPSVLSAWHRSRQLGSPVGQPITTAEGLFTNDYSLGAHARWLADTVLDGHIVPAKIIDHHTHVPLFASMMTLLEEFTFRDELLHSNGAVSGITKRLGRLTCIESKSLRRCPTCVAEDRKLFGCAHWRLFHQWPVARHCVVHGDALETCCGTCRTPFVKAKDAYLADDPCRRCGGTAGATSTLSSRPMPDGYWSLLNEMYRLQRLEPCTSGEWRCKLPALPENPGAAIGKFELFGMPSWVHDALEMWQVSSLAQLADALGEDWVWFNRVDRAVQFREWPPLIKLVLSMSYRSAKLRAPDPLAVMRRPIGESPATYAMQ